MDVSMEKRVKDKIEEAHEQDEIERLVGDFVASQTGSSERLGDIVFRDLSVIGAGVGHELVNNVPEALNRLLKLVNPAAWWSRRPAPSRVLLRKMTGTVREGEMLMVVGRPGSGCTTALKAIANMREEYLAMEGNVWYGSFDAMTAKNTRPDQVAFVGEDDIHFPSLSVNTTLRFALNARHSTADPDRASHLEQDLKTVLQLMGLEQAAVVRIGNDHIRGISGGQRRRVSLAEAFCTRASLYCFDNPTRGLDSSTAIRFLNVLRKYTTRSRCATVMSLYQASDVAVSLFDKILVLNEGHIAYYGPASSAKGYFESLGFYCSPRISISDFLASMSGTPDGRTPQDALQRPVPLRPADFEVRFWESSFYQQAVDAAIAPQSTAVLPKPSGYALPFYRQIYECTVRHYQIFLTDRGTWIAEATGTIVQALLLGTLFRDQQDVTQGLYTRCSALFFCVLIMGLQASAEFGNTFVQRPILLKQKALRFYRPGAYALGQILADIPWKFIFILYSLPIYWMINFQRTAGHFFTWLVCLYLGLMALSVMFRAIAVFTNSPTRAVLPVGLLLNVFIMYTGFYIPPPGMKVWLSWIRYLDPMYYIFESIALNEIGDGNYQCSSDHIVPRGATYNDTTFQTCAVSGSVPGNLNLSGNLYILAEYGFKYIHKWRNVGINAAFFVFFAILVTIGMERFRNATERMSTIYYQKLPWTKTSTSDLADVEKLPVTTDLGGFDATSNDESSVSRLEAVQHVFAWQELSLELGDGKRLLHEVSGKNIREQ
ncbi:Brefeldin A resistance protein [Penicillium subrubescens]|uniref:Brefeldin A resistance protein n=1 Tax=Penicillium subrubescens TaxID=1316194 RepID=A0A1Q5T4P6_9EURO|nr:Brefeldin A resistance protein [Penicillium subrubescens]